MLERKDFKIIEVKQNDDLLFFDGNSDHLGNFDLDKKEIYVRIDIDTYNKSAVIDSIIRYVNK